VTFLLDADGTLAVRAVDQQTGQQQSIRIALIGGVDEERIAAMQQRVDAKYAGDA
jgi:molecular chaperone DnaK (HSP70)